MNLLILLSALLSCLSGVSGPAWTSQAPVAVARSAETAVARASRTVAATGRPVAALPALGDVGRIGLRAAWRIAVTVPPYTGRRRE